MDDADTQLTRLLRYAKEASPEGLRDVLRPVVRRVLPEHVRARLQMLTSKNPADRWFDNRYTILDHGTKRQFFFLCGCFKSGTNWVQNLLNLHPHAFITGEFHFEHLRDAVDQLTGVYWFLGSEPELREVALDASEAMIRRLVFAASRGKPGAMWLGDRTPGPLRTIIRGAPMINITRDVRDVLVSWSFHHTRVDSEMGIALPFRTKWAEARSAFLADPEAFDPLQGLLGDEGWVRHHAKQWADMVRQSREALPRLKDEGSPVLELRYDRMHADLPGEVARLYGFLGLDPGAAHMPSAETRTLPGFKQEDRRSFFRKGAVGEWRETLDDRLCKIIKEEAGEEMILAGYEKDLGW